MAKNKNNNGRLLTQDAIIRQYGVTKKIIDKFFPKPIVRYNPKKRWAYTRLWAEDAVAEAVASPEVQAALAERSRQQKERAEYEAAYTLLLKYNPDNLIGRARALKRSFVLHVGPTNSGKTYQAVQALKAGGCGAYLGPLRLLALEMFDKINAEGIPCSLLTGEESIPVAGAQIVASTIELCDFSKHYKTAVIDEAQLITDGDRGSSWFKAICLVDAEEVHICLAPEALDYIELLLFQINCKYIIQQHERLVPLEYAGRCRGYNDIQPYDAIICFSRKNVLSTAALLERNGFSASVIYGALPPAARRNEVQKYTDGSTNVIVATDAIGMGVSLPIKRIIFAEVQKFDGKEQRFLKPAEIKQIAGRAGRFGMFERGEVLTMDKTDTVKRGLERSSVQIQKPCIAFPREVLETDISLMTLLKVWQVLPKNDEFKREDMADAITLLALLKGSAESAERSLIFDLITCPVDTNITELRYYWLRCASAIIRGKHIPEPYFDTDTLQGCETQYKAYDIHHQLLTRIGQEDSCTEAREDICRRIAELMAQDKSEYIRKCRNCGCELPIGYAFNVCKKCHDRSVFFA